MSKPQVLIVGCGAVGLSVGYFLSTGASITYLVRPGRKLAFSPPKTLYSYKDDDLYTFSEYRLVEDPSEISGEEFAFVFDTLDGHTARSEGGTATLQKVGTLVREKQNADCFVVCNAVGLDIKDHYAACLGIPKSRLLTTVSLLAHPPTPSISIPESADKTLVSKADLLYTPQSGNIGLVVFNSEARLVKKLRHVYEQNGKLKVQRFPTFAEPVVLLTIMHLMAWGIDGWKDFEHLVHNKPLWKLLLKAQSEILRLPRHGCSGWLLSCLLRSWTTAKMNFMAEEGPKPLNYAEFSAFHHGGKVIKQDIMLLENVLKDGEQNGRKMVALRELLEKAKQTS